MPRRQTPSQVANILDPAARGHPMIMATRVTPEATQSQKHLPRSFYFETARICALMDPSIETDAGADDEDSNPEKDPPLPIPTRRGNIAVLAAGTCDLPVAEEAVITARLYGFDVTRLYDVGVAGLHRLLSQKSQIIMQSADVIIVAAGMEGALPSVVAGLGDSPVVAVPTSIGYGASFNGMTALDNAVFLRAGYWCRQYRWIWCCCSSMPNSESKS